LDEYQQLLKQASQALAEGSWKTAIALATEATKLRPDLVQALLLHAGALMDGGMFTDALEIFDRAEEINPDDPTIVTNRGICMFELCRFDSAEGILEFALELDNRMAGAHHYLGLLMERKGDWLDANKHLARAHKLDPETFSLPVPIDDEEFSSLVESSMMKLPTTTIRDLDKVTIDIQLLPDEQKLTSYEPPLSPQILGLGMTDVDTKLKSIVLYQRNLQRIATDKADMEKQIRMTILYELRAQPD